MKIQTLSMLSCFMFCALFFPSLLMADDPGGMSEAIFPPEDLEITDGGAVKWLLYRAEEDGVLMLATHASNNDIVIVAYPEDWESGSLGEADVDFGPDGNNEVLALPVTQGEVFYFNIHPYDGGNLPATFHLMSAFIPGASLSAPLLDDEDEEFFGPANFDNNHLPPASSLD